MAPHFTVQQCPPDGWVATVDERVIPALYDTREEAEAMAHRLADEYGGYVKAAAPLDTEDAGQKMAHRLK